MYEPICVKDFFFVTDILPIDAKDVHLMNSTYSMRENFAQYTYSA